MQLTLSNEEAQTLHDVLNAYLPDLRRETARTDLPARELRRELLRREQLCERLIKTLEESTADRVQA